MRSLLVLATLAALALPARADGDGPRPGTGITATTSFMLGSLQVGDAHGLVAPGGHFDVGFRVRRWRLAAEATTGMWSESHPADERMYAHGGLTRIGMALQWAWKDLELRPTGRPAANVRGFVEIGMGRHRVETDLGGVTRDDLMLGVGMAPELKFGAVLFGATFGVRMLIAREPVTAIARGAATAERGLDIALLYVFGLRFGH